MLGLKCSVQNIDRFSFQLRAIGDAAETAMFSATGGVNTHKGFIFLGLIIASAFGELLRSNTRPRAEEIFSRAKELSKELCLHPTSTGPITTGVRAYWELGITGVRGIPSSDFSLVRKFGLPILRRSLNVEAPDVLISTLLLHFMAENEDTTILNRHFDKRRIDFVRDKSAECLALGGLSTSKGAKKIVRLDETFVKLNISPGGSADLVGIALFVLCLERFQNGPERIAEDLGFVENRRPCSCHQ